MEWINELEDKLWRTKGSRFNANKRITIKNQWSKYSMGFLSSYVIIINVYSIFLRNFTIGDISNIIPFFSFILGILILVINFMEGAKGLNLQAEKMLSSAKEISRLYDRLKFQSSLNNENIKDEVSKITEEYNSIMSKYDNHETIDYEYFKTHHPNEFELSNSRRNLIRFMYFIKPIFLYLTVILLTTIIIFWFIWTTFPAIKWN